MDYTMEELVPVVTMLSEKFTSKESTSITYERAEQLMEAILYCIRELEVSGSGTELMGNLSAFTAYEQGYRLVLKKVKQTKDIYDSMIPLFDSYGNVCYYDTVAKGLPQFFLRYDARFCPQNHLLTLDYPVLVPVWNLEGIDAIESYIKSVNLEQQFMNGFPKEFIVRILTDYDEHYKIQIFNLASVVMRSAVAHMIAGKSFHAGAFTGEELEMLKSRLKGMQQEDVYTLLKNGLKAIIDGGFKGNEALYLYLKEDLKDYCSELMNAVEFNCMNRVIFG